MQTDTSGLVTFCLYDFDLGLIYIYFFLYYRSYLACLILFCIWFKFFYELCATGTPTKRRTIQWTNLWANCDSRVIWALLVAAWGGRLSPQLWVKPNMMRPSASSQSALERIAMPFTSQDSRAHRLSNPSFISQLQSGALITLSGHYQTSEPAASVQRERG